MALVESRPSDGADDGGNYLGERSTTARGLITGSASVRTDPVSLLITGCTPAGVGQYAITDDVITLCVCVTIPDGSQQREKQQSVLGTLLGQACE